MPYRKKTYRKKRPIRRIKRKRGYKVPRYANVSKVVGFPESMITKLVYSQTVSSAVISLNQAFRGNSVFDPDFTGGGNQPNYFDTYASVYGQYRVVGCKMEARVINLSSSVAIRINLMPSDVSTFPTNVLNAAGNPYAVSAIVTPSGGSKSMATLKRYITTAKINGKTKAQVNGSDSYQATVSTNPADVWFWLFQAEDIGLSNAMNIQIDFKLTYYVRFTDKLNQNLS